MRRRMLMRTTSSGSVDLNNPIFLNYLTIEALEDGLTASLSLNACQYCVDGNGKWLSLSAGASTPAIDAGHYVSFKASITPQSYDGVGTFTISKKCNLLGNCNSLLFGDSAAGSSLSGKNYAFYELFSGNSNIITVSSNFLPATTIANYCYNYMFSGCTSLTAAPALPATTVGDYSYANMFSGCTSLTAAPALPATTIANYCYTNMFSGCSALTAAPDILPATTLRTSCYGYMFYNCASLTTAPTLPATTLVQYCYSYMFSGCSKLNYIKALFTTKPTSAYTNNWVRNVASKGTFVKSKSASWSVTGVHGSPNSWTIVKE